MASVSRHQPTGEQPKYPPVSHAKQIETTHTSEIAQNILAEQSHIAEKPEHHWGEVVVLVGTSSAGKSSIISELVIQKPNTIEHGIDLAGVNIPLAYLNEMHPEEMSLLRHVIEPTEMDIKYPSQTLNYIFGTEPTFKTGISTEDRERYTDVIGKLKESLLTNMPRDKIVSLMMDQIMIDSKRGNPVIFDVLNVKELGENILLKQHPAVKFVLVYIPFQTLAERVIIRNTEAVAEKDFLNARPGLFPLFQFTKIFRPKRDDTENVIQKLTLQEVEHCINSVYESGKAFWEVYDPKELDRRDLVQDKIDLREKILKKLGFKEGDDPSKTVELTPRYKGYHILINTSQTDIPKAEAVQESARQILFDH